MKSRTDLGAIATIIAMCLTALLLLSADYTHAQECPTAPWEVGSDCGLLWIPTDPSVGTGRSEIAPHPWIPLPPSVGTGRGAVTVLPGAPDVDVPWIRIPDIEDQLGEPTLPTIGDRSGGSCDEFEACVMPHGCRGAAQPVIDPCANSQCDVDPVCDDGACDPQLPALPVIDRCAIEDCYEAYSGD